MRFRVLPPDWAIYAIILGVILLNAMRSNDSIAPISPPPLGAALPGVQPSDPRIIVDLTEPQDSTGTAFAVDANGTWITARHVVDGCDQVGLLAGTSRAIKVDSVTVSERSDTAVLTTGWKRKPLATDLTQARTLREPGYFFGYPQGRPGEVAGSLLGRSQLITRGRYNTKEAVLAWAELGRTRGLTGTLGGLSGGPVFDSDGEVIGVVAAEAPRRGRIFTVAPSSVLPLIPRQTRPDARPITVDNFGVEADGYRRDRRIAQVVCLVQ